jgi:DNA-binding NtrC family response regulator
LPATVTGHVAAPPRVASNGDEKLADIQRAHVVEVLSRLGGNKARAARALGVNRRSLYRLIEKYKLEPNGGQTSTSH